LIVGASSDALWRVDIDYDSDPGTCTFDSTWDAHCSGGTLYWTQYTVYRWDGAAFAEHAHLTFGEDESPAIGAFVPFAGGLLLIDVYDGSAWSTP
jgi:hypothetical protein